MTEHTPLSDILNNEPTAEVPADEPTQETAEQQTQEQPEVATDGPLRDDRGRFAPKGEKQAEEAPAAPPAAEDERIPVAALKDERSKRQQAEDRARQLEEQLRQFQAQQQPAPQQQPQAEQGPPDRWEDPEGYDRWLMGQAIAAAEERARHAFQTQRIETSANAARAKYEDYDQAINVFGEMIQSTPGLYERMLQSPDPAEFAYTNAKTELELRQHGGIDALVKAKVEAALKEQMAQVQTRLPASPPPSITDSRSVGARSGPAWGGMTPLSEIIPQ